MGLAISILGLASLAFGQATCQLGRVDTFTPFDVSDATTPYRSSNGVNTGWVPALYGPDLGAGSNSESAVAGGAAHLADGQAVAAGSNISGGPNGVTPLCADGSLPAAGVCADHSTPTIGVALISMSAGHRYYNSGTAQTTVQRLNTFLNQRNKYSFLDFLVTPADRVDFTGAPVDTTYTVNPQVTFVDCGEEARDLADDPTYVGWANNLDWNDSTTPSPWWVCANVRVPNYSVRQKSTQAVTAKQIQVVEMYETMGLGALYQTILPLSNLKGKACTAANIDGGSGPVIFACDTAYYLGQALRNLKAGFPNVQMAFLDSMYYQGYARTNVQGPPCDYEHAFGVKKVIEAQIAQTANGGAVQDTISGDLCYKAPCPNGEIPVVPYIDWGMYAWAQGTAVPNASGLTWAQGVGSGYCPARAVADFNTADGCLHESTTGTAPGTTQRPPNGQSKLSRQSWLFYKNNADTIDGDGLTAFFAPAP